MEKGRRRLDLNSPLPSSLSLFPLVVRAGGVEPPRVTPQGPKPCAYSSSATPAYRLTTVYQVYNID